MVPPDDGRGGSNRLVRPRAERNAQRVRSWPFDRPDGVARDCCQIVNMHHAAFADGPPSNPRRAQIKRKSPKPFQTRLVFWRKSRIFATSPQCPSWRKITARSAPQNLAAVAATIFNTGCKSKVDAADDVQYVAGRSLIFERFLKICRDGFATRGTSPRCRSRLPPARRRLSANRSGCRSSDRARGPKGEPPDYHVTPQQRDNQRRLCRDAPHNGV